MICTINVKDRFIFYFQTSWLFLKAKLPAAIIMNACFDCSGFSEVKGVAVAFQKNLLHQKDADPHTHEERFRSRKWNSWNNQMCRNAAIHLSLLRALALFLTMFFLFSPCSRISHPIARLTASPAWWVLLSLLCWTTVTLHLMVGELLLCGQLLTQNFKNSCFCCFVQKKGLFLSSPGYYA